MKIKQLIAKATVFIVLFLIIGIIYTQTKVDSIKLNANTKAKTIQALSTLLQQDYLFPDVALKMSTLLQTELKKGAYDSIDDPRKFAEKLTSDLRTVNDDKHLIVIFAPDDAKQLLKNKGKEIPAAKKKEIQRAMQQDNYGFKKVQILPGNIGYIDFRMFAPPEDSKETVATAMRFVSNSDALIFDLRQNHGGAPTGIQLICSYLFGDTPVHLNDLYYRAGNRTQSFWTLKTVDGEKMPNIPVYILTSQGTFSGAEEFAYNLKNLKRAVIVGETTGGGAHIVDGMAINTLFIVAMPDGQAINPITKTNWEGTGVTPDVAVPADKALNTAQLLALQKIVQQTTNNDQKKMAQWVLDSLQGLKDAPVITPAVLQSFAGTYGDNRHILYDNGALFYQRGDFPLKIALSPISEDTFIFSDMSDIQFSRVRLQFNKNANGQVAGLTELYEDGHSEYSAKN